VELLDGLVLVVVALVLSVLTHLTLALTEALAGLVLQTQFQVHLSLTQVAVVVVAID
jgi:hypothetical protein